MRVLKLLKDFEECVRRHEMKGSFRPEEFDEIEEDYEIMKARMVKALNKRIAYPGNPNMEQDDAT